MDPNSGREKHVTGGGKGVKKRGEGLGTGGPVGKSDGYAGRKAQYEAGSSNRPSGQNNRTQRSSGGRSPMGLGVIVLVVILFIVFGRGCLGSGGSVSTGTGGSTGYTQQTPQTTQQQTPAATPSGTTQSGTSGNTQSSGYGGMDLGSLYGFTGSNGVSNGWSSSGNNTAKLNRDVAEGAREKRTQILGNGNDTVTIMIYMCGTDLESKSGMATRDMMEMCKASLSDNVNILIYTGGCRRWQVNGISNSVNQVYRVTSSGLQRLIEDDGAKVMTDPATLSGFIKWCAKNFPANRNDLIFWDHGCGSISGYGYDEKYPNQGSMSLAGINKALSDAGVTFDFIGFDACLMATYETAIMSSKYADYMIASEETEPGIGWYYTDWLSSLCADTSQETIDTGKNIIDGFVNKCAQDCAGQKATLSIIDLAELEKTVPKKLASFSGNTVQLIKGDNYKQVSNARANTREFAASSRIDQIDLVDFANKIGTTEAAELADTLLSAVKYNRTSSNMTNSYGVSIYFPYQKASKVASMTSIYEQIGMDAEYSECIRSFAGLETCGQISGGGSYSPFGSLMGSSSAYGDIPIGSDAISALLSAFMSGGRSVEGIDRNAVSYLQDEDTDYASEYISVYQFDPYQMQWVKNSAGQTVMSLPDESWDMVQTLQMNMFYDDGEGFIDLGLDNIYEFTQDNCLIGDSDNTWLSIDGQPVAFYYETTIIDGNSKTITGRVPALLDGDRVNLIIVFDNEHPYGYIAGAAYVYSDDVTAVPKSVTEIAEGTQIDFICDYYSYDGTYQDTYYLGEPVSYTEGLEISNTYVGDDTQITYLLTDIYNNEYWTPVVPQ